MTHIVTIFKDIKETEAPFHREVDLVLNRIKEGATKELIKKIRKENNKQARNELKKMLPAICFSGTFNKRSDNAIHKHSGLICLDFDGYLKIKELLQDKEVLCKDKYVMSVFISPSGKGLKVLVKIPSDIENHINYFNSLEKHFNSPNFDKVTRNISRVCYESYDPFIYINYNSSIWDSIIESEYVEINKHTDIPTIPISDENKVVDILIKWWTKKYPMVEGQRNQNAYVLAMAFNDYGINKSLSGYILNQYQTDSFGLVEIHRTIESAYSNIRNFGTKYYEDEDKINEIKTKLKRGVSKKEIRNHLLDSNISNDTIDLVLDKIQNEKLNKYFWTKNEKGVIKIVHFLFKDFLKENGFHKYCPEGGKNYVFVKVTNNLIDHTSEKEIKDFTLTYLEQLDDLSIYNYFADQTRFFKEDFLTLLSTIDIYFIEDNKDVSYLYYKNCAVKITKNKIELIDYLDLGGFVWKDHVIDRKFKICNNVLCDYKTLISRISANNNERIQTMESTIGFLMHGYKNLSYCPAVILNDEIIGDNPEGGTGKGLFMNALGKMKKLVVIDGKAFAFEKSFPYQLVSVDTQILCFDDVKNHFDFERLFSVVTEGLTLEKKNKDAIKIPFSKSPKISITTNYTIKGSGNSFARRKWVVELSQHYSKGHTPLIEFGKHLFVDWDETEWCQFDNYMISCLQKYLSEGLIISTSVNSGLRDLSEATSYEFLDWCGLIGNKEENPLLQIGKKFHLQDLYLNFIFENSDHSHNKKASISRTAFYKWVKLYAIYKTQKKPFADRDSMGKYIIILPKD
jgi:hypothetical protein